MAQGAIEHAALAPHALPCHRHHAALDPGGMLTAKGGGGQHLVRRVYVHVVLLGMHVEIAQPGHDGVLRLDDLHIVIDDPARVGHPLAAYHELVLGVVAEGIAHAAVPAGDPDASLDGIEEPLLLLAGDGAHGPRRDHQVQGGHLVRIQIRIQGVGDLHSIARILQEGRKDIHTLLGLVAEPPAPHHQCLFHRIAS